MRTAVGERSHRQVGSVSAAGSNERKRNNAKEEGYGEARISYQCRLVGYVNRGKRQGGYCGCSAMLRILVSTPEPRSSDKKRGTNVDSGPLHSGKTLLLASLLKTRPPLWAFDIRTYTYDTQAM